MAFPFVFLVIVLCFSSVIHVSAEDVGKAAHPHDPQPAVKPHDPKTAAHPHDPQPAVKSHDSKTASHPHDPQPAVKSHDPKTATHSQDPQPAVKSLGSKTAAHPQDSQSAVKSLGSKTAAHPKDPQPAVKSLSSKTAAHPQDPQPAVNSLGPKTAVKPQDPQPAVNSLGPKTAVKPQDPQPAVNSLGPKIPTPPGLSEDYYAKTCPNFDKILLETITPKQTSNPTTAAATLRVFFHDCFVQGCDGSVLVNPTPSGPTERENPLNLDLPGDAFDVILRVKTALELSCPGVVSCSDILASVTRHLVKQVGGPFYKVLLGKKDGKVSKAENVDHNLVDEKQNFDTMFAPFQEKGFTVREMVALLGGGHTIGFAHCSKFASRIFKFSPTQEIDPSLNPSFAQKLRTLCADYVAKPDLAAFMDPMTPGKFDNNFFSNLLRGLDLLPSDHILLTDPRSKPIVEEYAKDSNKFFTDFAQTMEKLNVLGVKTGADGEIRTNCFSFNSNP